MCVDETQDSDSQPDKSKKKTTNPGDVSSRRNQSEAAIVGSNKDGDAASEIDYQTFDEEYNSADENFSESGCFLLKCP